MTLKPTVQSEHDKFTEINGETVVRTVPYEAVPTDPAKSNASLTLGYDVSNNLTTITKVIDGVTYTQTLTYTNGNLTNISPWS